MHQETAILSSNVILTGINNVDIDTGTTRRVIVIPVGQGASGDAIRQYISHGRTMLYEVSELPRAALWEILARPQGAFVLVIGELDRKISEDDSILGRGDGNDAILSDGL